MLEVPFLDLKTVQFSWKVSVCDAKAKLAILQRWS